MLTTIKNLLTVKKQEAMRDFVNQHDSRAICEPDGVRIYSVWVNRQGAVGVDSSFASSFNECRDILGY